MKFKEALGYPFHADAPWTNLALIALCQVIPIVGPITVLGYGVLAEKQLVRNIATTPPRFEFRNFARYLERGLMPFLVQLVLSFALSFVILPLTWGGMFLMFYNGAAGHVDPKIWAVEIAIWVLFMIVWWLAFTVLMTPFMLRAALLGNFTAAFDFRWALDFCKRAGGTTVLTMFIFQCIAIPIFLAGFIACYFGLFFSAAIVMLMHWHLQVQLYLLYLDRGGTPLVFRDEEIAPAFPVLTAPPIIAPPRA